jgi:hypothetical protein
MSNLFGTVEFNKTATHAVLVLDTDSTKWSKQIIHDFMESYPYLQQMPLLVRWKEKDFSKGYAVGSLDVGGVKVPLVVKEFILAPRDVMIVGDTVLPLTHETLKEVTTSESPFKGVQRSPVKGSTLLFHNQIQHTPNPNASSGYPYAALRQPYGYMGHKYASIIDSLENIDKTAADKIIAQVENDPVLKNAFVENDTIEVLHKLASKEVGTFQDSMDALVRDLDIDRQATFKDSHGNYTIKQANAKVDFVWKVPVTESEAEEFGMLTVGEAPASFEKVASAPDFGEFILDDCILTVHSDKTYSTAGDADLEKVATFEEIEGDMPQVGEHGTFLTGKTMTTPFTITKLSSLKEYLPNGEMTNVYPMLGEPRTMYIDKLGEWHIADEITEKTAESFEPEGDHPNLGDYGVWCINGKVSEPFDIMETTKVASVGGWEMKAWDGRKNIVYYPINPESDGFTAHETEKYAFYVPGNAIFMRLEKKAASQQLADMLKISAKLCELAPTVDNPNDSIVFETSEASYIVTDRVEEFTKHAMYPNAYLVPETSTFIKLAGERIEEPSEKVENVFARNIVERDGLGLYQLSGPDFEKYAVRHDIRDLDVDTAYWAALHCGAYEEDLIKVSSMKKHDKVKFDYDMFAPMGIEKIAESIKENYIEEISEVDEIAVNLVKEAAIIPDKNTVDAVLSLGLIKKNNIMEFVNMLPQYEMLMSEMAKLLLASRVGLNGLPEDAIKSAMLSVTDVVLALQRIGRIKTAK